MKPTAADSTAPLMLGDGRIYDVLNVDVQQLEPGLVDQSVIVWRCVLEVEARHQRGRLCFLVNVYPNAFRRRLLNIRNPASLVTWTRRWVWQYLSDPQRPAHSDEYKRMADGSIVVECW